MSSINLETMKQLLDEFTEKEALADEEIKIVEAQIRELTLRVEQCHQKIKTIAEDKEKVSQMMSRYGENGSFALSGIADNSPELQDQMAAIDSDKKENKGRSELKSDAGGLAARLGVGGNNKAVQSNSQKTAAKDGQSKQVITGPLSSGDPGSITEDKLEPVADTRNTSHTSNKKGAGGSIDSNNAEERADSKSKNADEKPDDAVKSINDALRGLFR